MERITGRDDRPGITGASGELAPEVRRWLAAHGISEDVFRAATEVTSEERRMQKSLRKVEAHLAEATRLQVERNAYETRKRETEAAGR